MPIPVIQPKLTIGQPNDEYEQEADRVAGKIMRMSESEVDNPGHGYVQRQCTTCLEEEMLQSKPLVSQTTPWIQRKIRKEAPSYARARKEKPFQMNPGLFTESNVQLSCDECKIDTPSAEELKEDETGIEEFKETTQVNKKAESTEAKGPIHFQNFESALRTKSGKGNTLPENTLSFMQNRFMQNFSDVRVHTDTIAAEMNDSLSSKAFTHGKDIYFNQGRYSPNSGEGRNLIAHELTHTIQQTGISSNKKNIQLLPEYKIGNWAHSEIQERLRNADKKLITEAPIPGGTRLDDTKHNAVGFADLYKAEKQTVSGVMAYEPDKSKPLEEDDKHYKYKNMSRGKTKFSKWEAMRSKSPINYGPTIEDKKWKFVHNFPPNFQIGELKPLFKTDFHPSSYATLVGAGYDQMDKYIKGFENFVKTVKANKGKEYPQLPKSITGRPLKYWSYEIPNAINYEKFETENKKKPGRDAIAVPQGKPTKRIWIHSLKNGVYVYFILPHPFEPDTFPTAIESQLQSLDPLLVKLRQKQAEMNNSLIDTKPDKEARAKKKPTLVKNLHKKSNTIQADGTKTDWKEKGRLWEEERKNWVKAEGKFMGKEKPKKFLKEQAKGFEKKANVDKKTGKAGVPVTVSEQMRDKIKKSKKIRFWSSTKGRILGALRFRFGGVFDKIKEKFQEIKEKFRKHHKNSDKLNKKGGIFGGWKKTATRAIIRFCVTILKDMLVFAFGRFVNCINGIVKSILGEYNEAIKESKEELLQKIEPVCCNVMSFKKELEAKYKEHEETIATFTDAIETIQKWREILSYVEAAVRLGVQILSCGTPPGLGCLWGLVAQIGIGVGLDLLSRTDYFENEIAKPAAGALMNAIVGNTFHNFLINLLAETPLKPYLQKATACKKRTTKPGRMIIGGNLHKLDPNNPENAKIRAAWEAQNEKQILKDLQSVFEKGKGKKATKADLEKLLEAIKQKQHDHKKIIKLIQSSKNPATGKLNIKKATKAVESGKMQTGKAKARKLDYEKAIKNNIRYAKWYYIKPTDYIKIPGIKVDTKEFAEGIYDMQKALGMHPDGMLGPKTIVKFHEENKLKKGASYKLAKKKFEKDATKKGEAKKEKSVAEEKKAGPSIKIIEAVDVKIKDKRLSKEIYGYDIYRPTLKSLVSNYKTHKYLTLDININNVPHYRVRDIIINEIKFQEILARPETIIIMWIYLKDGIQLNINGEERILKLIQLDLSPYISAPVNDNKWHWK